MVQQVRCGIYPQLENPGAVIRKMPSDALPIASNFIEYRRRGYNSGNAYTAAQTYFQPDEDMSSLTEKNMLLTQALIQTGPGLPSWEWRTFNMQWNGPVGKDQAVRLWLVPPVVNRVLAFLRVALLGVMIFGLADFRYLWQIINNKTGTVAMVFAILLLPCISEAETRSLYYPPTELLQELQSRLLEKPDCTPFCADYSHMKVKAEQDNLEILLEIQAGSRTVVPLPGNSESWIPGKIFLDQQPVKGIIKDSEGFLWILIPPGIHTVTLIGKTGAGNTVRIPLPLKPHQAESVSEGWDIQGIDKNGRVEASIQLNRLKNNGPDQSTAGTNNLPPFFHVERVLQLGFTWEISNVIKRMTPPGIPVVVPVPLLKGESVTTPGIRVENGLAYINMEPKAWEIRWLSTIKISSEIQLQAPESVPWTETWILDANPLWHCEVSGISVIHHQDEEGHWRPEWRPWPREKVNISISRPAAIPGKTLTIDNVELKLTPGLRFSKAELNMVVRTSRGCQHTITLPDNAKLQLVKLDDKSKPIPQEGQNVAIPLYPGTQNIYLEWYQADSSSLLTKGPSVKTGEQSVNAHVTFDMPSNRWILWAAGPRLGPAVLFWTYLVIIILAAIGLGRTSLTPLRTYHWLLLGLGLTQVHSIIAILVAGWLLALGSRKKYLSSDRLSDKPPDKLLDKSSDKPSDKSPDKPSDKPSDKPGSHFNLIQVVLAVWTLAALFSLYMAVQNGLLGIPDMQIAGNGSCNSALHWTQDRIDGIMPQPWVLSLPLWVYHLLMLFWALWLAISLLKWLRWGWSCISEG